MFDLDSFRRGLAEYVDQTHRRPEAVVLHPATVKQLTFDLVISQQKPPLSPEQIERLLQSEGTLYGLRIDKDETMPLQEFKLLPDAKSLQLQQSWLRGLPGF